MPILAMAGRRVAAAGSPAGPVLKTGRGMSQTDFSDCCELAGHCDRVSPNPDNAHAVVLDSLGLGRQM